MALKTPNAVWNTRHIWRVCLVYCYFLHLWTVKPFEATFVVVKGCDTNKIWIERGHCGEHLGSFDELSTYNVLNYAWRKSIIYGLWEIFPSVSNLAVLFNTVALRTQRHDIMAAEPLWLLCTQEQLDIRCRCKNSHWSRNGFKNPLQTIVSKKVSLAPGNLM